MKKYCSRKTSTALICILGFLVGIPFIYNGGFFLFDLVDGVATLVSLFIVLFLEAFLACIPFINKVNILDVMKYRKLRLILPIKRFQNTYFLV